MEWNEIIGKICQKSSQDKLKIVAEKNNLKKVFEKKVENLKVSLIAMFIFFYLFYSPRTMMHEAVNWILPIVFIRGC